MKGLVFKDLLLMKKMNKKVIFVMYFFVIAISFFGENEVYSIMSSAFFSLFIGMHLMMTMTYDGLTSWKQYELTLPMSKYKIIFSKYLTSLLLVPISIMGTVIIYIIRYVVYHNFTLSQFGFSIAIAIALPVLWCSICLAIAQWFGYMRVQYVRMICTLLVVCNRTNCSCYVIATNLSFHIILNPTRADFLQNHGKSASFLCWENERKHLILLTFFNVTLL